MGAKCAQGLRRPRGSSVLATVGQERPLGANRTFCLPKPQRREARFQRRDRCTVRWGLSWTEPAAGSASPQYLLQEAAWRKAWGARGGDGKIGRAPQAGGRCGRSHGDQGVRASAGLTPGDPPCLDFEAQGCAASTPFSQQECGLRAASGPRGQSRPRRVSRGQPSTTRPASESGCHHGQGREPA